MVKTFKKEFIANGYAARVMRIKNSKNAYIFKIRYRRNGYNIIVSASTLERAKEKFLIATRPENIEQYLAKNSNAKSATFTYIAKEWLQTKLGTIHDRTYQGYVSNCEKRIFPVIGNRRIDSLTTADFKKLIDEAKGRVIETLQTIFKGVMQYAMANGIITYNPMSALTFKKVKRNTRDALSLEQQAVFFERLKLSEFDNYRTYFLLQYYFGLRPCEIDGATLENDFLVATNAKHGGLHEIVKKKIPVPTQLKEYLDNTSKIECPHKTDVLNRVFQRIMQSKDITQYSLRHTFATNCQQYVRPDIVDIWMGDSSERLVGRVYTHFPDSFMQEEMQKVSFPF